MFSGTQYNAKQCTAVSGLCVLVIGAAGGGGLVLQRHWHVIVVMS